MEISSDRVVAIDYTLKDDDGKVIDSSEGKQPLYYLHGHNNIVAGLEKALVGHQVGDEVTVSVPPVEGYGEYNDALCFEIPKSQLPDKITPQKGMQLQMRGQAGPMPVTITKVKLSTVVVDANHELVDKTLNFSVTVREVRKATKKELEDGRAESPGSH